MNNFKQMLMLLFLLLATAGYVMADDFVIYLNKDQTEDQIDKDKYDCYMWAKEQTGFDPMETPKTTEPPPPKEAKKGGIGKGAVRGGLVGVAVGAIAGDAEKGAAIGAVAGGLTGGMRSNDQKVSEEKKQEGWAKEQSQQYINKRASYNKAYSACLEGKDYTVK
jgi:hypothetical protein